MEREQDDIFLQNVSKDSLLFFTYGESSKLAIVMYSYLKKGTFIEINNNI